MNRAHGDHREALGLDVKQFTTPTHSDRKLIHSDILSSYHLLLVLNAIHRFVDTKPTIAS